jgi:hypothetical protein
MPRYFVLLKLTVEIYPTAIPTSMFINVLMKPLSRIIRAIVATSDVVWRTKSRRVICTLELYLQMYRSRQLDGLGHLRSPCVTSAFRCVGGFISPFIATHLRLGAEESLFQWTGQVLCFRDGRLSIGSWFLANSGHMGVNQSAASHNTTAPRARTISPPCILLPILSHSH